MQRGRLEDFWYRIEINRIDRYIISRFLGTFAFTLMLIMLIIVVIDVQEKLSTFLRPDVTLNEIVFDYYVSLIPYYAVLLSPLFIFITVIFFTSKLASRSEIIAIQAAGMSFARLLRPYFISAAILSLLSFTFSSGILPYLNKKRISFTNKYINENQVVQGDNIQVELSPGVYAFFSTFDSRDNTGRYFSMEKFDGKTLKSRMTAERLQYNPDSLYHWKVYNYRIRTFDGMYESTVAGDVLDTLLTVTPADLILSSEDAQLLTTTQLYQYIRSQKRRGLANIQSFQIEYHQRFASMCAAFILTLIGVSLSARKVKGGIGLNIAVGLGLTFSYILLFTVSASYAISGQLPPIVAAWLPNIIYLPIAIFFYYKAPR